jgi:hypothetical protein
MNRKHTSSVRWLVVLSSAIALLVAPILVFAQEVEGVEPGEGQQGQELTITLRGNGFSDGASVTIGDLEIQRVQVVSSEEIRVRVRIPEDAPPGPRDVQVVVEVEGQERFSIVREGGFTVVGAEPLPPDETPVSPVPPGPPTPPDWWLLLIILAGGGVIVVGGGALAVTLAVRARRVSLQKQARLEKQMQEQWQQEAEEELPEKCRSGTHKVIRGKPKLKPGLWKVAGLRMALYDEASTQGGDERDAPEEMVGRIDKAARNKLLWSDGEKLAAEIVEIGRALAAHVIAWQARSQTGRDVRIEPEIEGGEGSVTFTLYRCVGPPTWWQEVKSWQAKAQAVKHFSQEFRGPTAGEAPGAYRAMLEKGLSIYVRNLIREAARLWDTAGVGVSVEVSLE